MVIEWSCCLGGTGSEHLRTTKRLMRTLLKIGFQQCYLPKTDFDNLIDITPVFYASKNGVANGVSSSNTNASGRHAPSTNHSMLMFIKPSWVSVIPCNPTRFDGPPGPFILPLLPVLLTLSPETWTLGTSRLPFELPHQPPSRCKGDWGQTGLF